MVVLSISSYDFIEKHIFKIIHEFIFANYNINYLRNVKYFVFSDYWNTLVSKEGYVPGALEYLNDYDKDKVATIVLSYQPVLLRCPKEFENVKETPNIICLYDEVEKVVYESKADRNAKEITDRHFTKSMRKAFIIMATIYMIKFILNNDKCKFVFVDDNIHNLLDCLYFSSLHDHEFIRKIGHTPKKNKDNEFQIKFQKEINNLYNNSIEISYENILKAMDILNILEIHTPYIVINENKENIIQRIHKKAKYEIKILKNWTQLYYLYKIKSNVIKDDDFVIKPTKKHRILDYLDLVKDPPQKFRNLEINISEKQMQEVFAQIELNMALVTNERKQIVFTNSLPDPIKEYILNNNSENKLFNNINILSNKIKELKYLGIVLIIKPVHQFFQWGLKRKDYFQSKFQHMRKNTTFVYPVNKNNGESLFEWINQGSGIADVNIRLIRYTQFSAINDTGSHTVIENAFKIKETYKIIKNNNLICKEPTQYLGVLGGPMINVNGCTINTLPILEVFCANNIIWTLDHRRLIAYTLAGYTGRVRVKFINDEKLLENQYFKINPVCFNTDNMGKYIHLRVDENLMVRVGIDALNLEENPFAIMASVIDKFKKDSEEIIKKIRDFTDWETVKIINNNLFNEYNNLFQQFIEVMEINIMRCLNYANPKQLKELEIKMKIIGWCWNADLLTITEMKTDLNFCNMSYEELTKDYTFHHLYVNGLRGKITLIHLNNVNIISDNFIFYTKDVVNSIKNKYFLEKYLR